MKPNFFFLMAAIAKNSPANDNLSMSVHHSFFWWCMRPCTCDSCFRFEQASGFPKFLAPRTIRHHLQKQKALPESPLVDFPPPPSLVASASSLPSLVDSSSSPSPPSLVDSPSLPSFLDSHSHISPDLPIEQGADEVPAIAFRGRGRPRASVVFANQPLGDLLLDTRDKFPNMTVVDVYPKNCFDGRCVP